MGDTRRFWNSPHVANMPQANEQIDATLATKSAHGYVWVESQYYVADAPAVPEGGIVTQEEAENAAADWEIYPIDREYFGEEPRPDVVP